VEILHGPASSVYGDAALGGVVQAFTRAKAEPQGIAELSAGSFETAALDVDWGHSLDRGRVGLGATVVHTGGEREHSGGDEGGADAFFATPMGGGQLRFTLAASRRARDDPGALGAEQAARDSDVSDPLFRFDREETGRARAAVSFVREGRSEVRGMLSYALRDAQLTRTLPLLPHVGDRALRDLDTHSLAFSMEAGRDLGLAGRESRLRAGFDVGLDGLDTAYFPVGPDGASGPQSAAATGARRRLAGYVTQDIRPLDRLRISGGLRWDGIRDELGEVSLVSHSAWSPRLGANFRLGNDGGAPVVLYVQASRAFKSATLDQVLDPRPLPDGAGGTFTISNPELTPERARSFEAGVRRDGASLRCSLVAYRIDVDDEIDFDLASYRYRNIGRSRHTGIEARMEAGDGHALAPEVSYAWTRVVPRTAEAPGLQLKNIPEHTLRFALRAALPAAVRGELRFTWTGGTYLDDANQFPLEGRRVLDLRLQRPVTRRFAARLDLLNLLDQRYQEVGFLLPDLEGGQAPFVFPSPGFSIRAGLSATF